MKSIRFLITLFTFLGINFFVFNVSLIKILEVKSPNLVEISLDLSNIDSENFQITKYDEGPEAYKITPKVENEIDIIKIGNDVIWMKNVSSKCLGITIYESDVEEILFALNIIENEVSYSLHYLKNDDLLYIGIIEFLDLINDEFTDKEQKGLQKLDLSDDYHKLFYFYVLKEHDNTSYESYEPFDDDIFVKIVDGDKPIFEWESGSKYIEIYKIDGKYFLLSIHLSDGRSIFLRYNEEEGRLTQTSERVFHMEIGHWGLRRFRYIRDTRYYYSFEHLTNIERKKLNDTSIDISLRNKNWDYTSISIVDDRFIVSRPIEPKVIKTITDNGVVILKGYLENVSITHLKTSDGRYYLEVSWSEGELRRPNLYFEKNITDGVWNQINQKEFHDSFSKHIMDSNPPSTIKYLDIDGLTSGHSIESLPEHIREKIISLTSRSDNVNNPKPSVKFPDEPSQVDHDSVDQALISQKPPDKKSKLKVSENPPKEHLGNLESSFLWSSMNLTFMVLWLSLFWKS